MITACCGSEMSRIFQCHKYLNVVKSLQQLLKARWDSRLQNSTPGPGWRAVLIYIYDLTERPVHITDGFKRDFFPNQYFVSDEFLYYIKRTNQIIKSTVIFWETYTIFLSSSLYRDCKSIGESEKNDWQLWVSIRSCSSDL